MLRAAGITGLAYLLSVVLMQPFSLSIASLVSSNDKHDFDITDFYNIIADSRAVRTVDRDITILDITGATRSDVAEVLAALPSFEPRTVGLDVVFDVPHADDSLLLASIAAMPEMVMLMDAEPVKARNADIFTVGDTSFFRAAFPTHTYAASNLPTKSAGGVVRELRLEYPLLSGDTLPSFALAVAAKADSTCLTHLRKRNNDTELINYPSRRFNTVFWQDMPYCLDAIKDHIVLIGALENPGDLHATPSQHQMAGIEIHAYAASTILNAKYIDSLPSFWNMAIAFALCFGLALIHISLPPEFKPLVLRLIQIGLLYCIIIIGYHFFIEKKLVVNFSYSLLMLTFVLFACDIWLGFQGVRKYIRRRKK